MANYCPFCGEELAEEGGFCPFCGEELPSVSKPQRSKGFAANLRPTTIPTYSRPSLPNKDLKSTSTAVIFTNLNKLARKFCYGGNSEWETQRRVEQAIYNYTQFWEGNGVEQYLVLDAGEYEPQLLDDSTWKGHLRVLDDFCTANGISEKSPASIFIIGGSDVIPVPRIKNFAAWDYTLDTDLPYAYGSKSLKIGEGQCVDIEAFFRNRPRPRFYVSRLPFEEGFVNDGLEILENYFANVQKEYEANTEGSFVKLTKSVGMTVKDWMFETDYIQQDIPIMANIKDVNGLVENGLFICPSFDLNDERARDLYFKNAKAADFLFFNTHGGDEPGAAQYSNGVPIFDPQCFQKINDVKLMASLACYGARYISYKRYDSMLLTALNDAGILSFFGSSRCSAVSNGPNGEVLYGALLLKLYLDHLLNEGLPMAESFMKAKYELIDSGGDEEMRMLTIFEFDVYGEPMLQFSERSAKGETWNTVFSNFDNRLRSFGSRRYQTVYNKSAHDSGKPMSILDKVRQSVDASFMRIRSTIDKELYSKYGIKPESLASACSVSTLGKKSYRLIYDQTGDPSRATTVCADDKGNIKEVIYSR